MTNRPGPRSASSEIHTFGRLAPGICHWSFVICHFRASAQDPLQRLCRCRPLDPSAPLPLGFRLPFTCPSDRSGCSQNERRSQSTRCFMTQTNPFAIRRGSGITLALRTKFLLFTILLAVCSLRGGESESSQKEGESPADHLPAHIKRITWFGERADWSHDGKRILFLEKTFGDVYEVERDTSVIRPLTHHYRHHGYTRALYLASGDILLSGPEEFDPQKPGDARAQCWLSVLDKSLTKPAAPLGTKCSEGPAVSRKRMHIAWTHVSAQYPDQMEKGSSRML